MSPSGQRVIHRWNPAEVLGLANPAKYSASKWSCPAQTSQKTRCLKTRDASSYTAATHLLNERSIIDPATFLDNKDLLVKLATLTLCAANHLHQYRKLPGSGKPTSSVDLVVTGWVALISRYVAKKNDDSRKPASSADSLSLKSDLYEEQRHQNSTLAVVDDEALSAIDSQFISQHRVPADLLIKVEGYGVQGHPDGHQALYQTFSVSGPPASGASPDASDQLDLKAFKVLTLENNRLKTEKARLQRENKKMKKKLARVERELKVVEKERDDFSSQVDELYNEINEVGDRLERLEISE